MALLAHVSQASAELYLDRFILEKTRYNLRTCDVFYAPLVEFAELEYHKGESRKIVVSIDSDVGCVTSKHFNLIQADAEGWTHLAVWFPPVKTAEIGELRLLMRAGLRTDVLRQFQCFT